MPPDPGGECGRGVGVHGVDESRYPSETSDTKPRRQEREDLEDLDDELRRREWDHDPPAAEASRTKRTGSRSGRSPRRS